MRKGAVDERGNEGWRCCISTWWWICTRRWIGWILRGTKASGIPGISRTFQPTICWRWLETSTIVGTITDSFTEITSRGTCCRCQVTFFLMFILQTWLQIFLNATIGSFRSYVVSLNCCWSYIWIVKVIWDCCSWALGYHSSLTLLWKPSLVWSCFA